MARYLTAFILLLSLLACNHSHAADDLREVFAKSYQYERSLAYADAIKVLLVVKEKNYFVDLRLGWLYYLSGNYANARQAYQSAIQAQPKAIEPRLGYMLPLLAQERYDEVEAAARAVLTMDANNYLASLRLSIALRMQLKYAQAYEVNASMLELYPTDVSFLAEQLLDCMGLKRFDEANRLCAKILILDPENITAKNQLALLAPPTKPSK